MFPYRYGFEGSLNENNDNFNIQNIRINLNKNGLINKSKWTMESE